MSYKCEGREQPREMNQNEINIDQGREGNNFQRLIHDVHTQARMQTWELGYRTATSSLRQSHIETYVNYQGRIGARTRGDDAVDPGCGTPRTVLVTVIFVSTDGEELAEVAD